MLWLLSACWSPTSPPSPPPLEVPLPQVRGTERRSLADFLIPRGSPSDEGVQARCLRGEDTRDRFPADWAILQVMPGSVRLGHSEVLPLDGWDPTGPRRGPYLPALADALKAQADDGARFGSMACWNHPEERLLLVADARTPTGLLTMLLYTAAQAGRGEVALLVRDPPSAVPASGPDPASAPAPAPAQAPDDGASPLAPFLLALVPPCADGALVELGTDGVRSVSVQPRHGDRVPTGQRREGPLGLDESVQLLHVWTTAGSHPLDLVVHSDPDVPLLDPLVLWSRAPGHARPVWATGPAPWTPKPAPERAGVPPELRSAHDEVSVIPLLLPQLGTACTGADGTIHDKEVLTAPDHVPAGLDVAPTVAP